MSVHMGFSIGISIKDLIFWMVKHLEINISVDTGRQHFGIRAFCIRITVKFKSIAQMMNSLYTRITVTNSKQTL